MPLPVPVPQSVNNMGPSIAVTWRQLGSGLNGVASLIDATGTVVATGKSQQGDSFCSIAAPSSFPNAPYHVVVAATDGTNVGDPSPAVEVLLTATSLRQLTYDGQVVGLNLAAGPSANVQHFATLRTGTTPDRSFPSFPGLAGTFPLANASATTTYQVTMTDVLVVPVQSPYSCSSFSPSGTGCGVITQPATVTGASYAGTGQYDVAATGPTSAGPAITGHSFRFGGSTGEGDDVEGGVEGRLTTVRMSAGDGTVRAAGTGTSGTVSVRGPFSAPFYLVTAAPTGARLVLTTAEKLRAAWTAVPPLPPPIQILYEASLYQDGVLVDQQETTDPAHLSVEFGVPLAAGSICETRVVAVSGANSSGPPSDPAWGPLRASSPTVSYDGLGRLTSLPIAGWGIYEYTYDDAGNVLTARVSPETPADPVA